MAYQLAGDAGGVSGSETLSPGPKRSSCVGAHQQHSGGLLHKPPRWSAVTPSVQAGAPDPCVVPRQTPLAERSLHPWAPHCGSRHSVKAGAEARGFGECLARLRWTFLQLGRHRNVPLNKETLNPLVHSDSYGSPGAGCYGTDLAETSSVCLSPNCSAPRSSGKSALGQGPADASCPVLAGPRMILGPDFSSRRLSLGDSC